MRSNFSFQSRASLTPVTCPCSPWNQFVWRGTDLRDRGEMVWIWMASGHLSREVFWQMTFPSHPGSSCSDAVGVLTGTGWFGVDGSWPRPRGTRNPAFQTNAFRNFMSPCTQMLVLPPHLSKFVESSQRVNSTENHFLLNKTLIQIKYSASELKVWVEGKFMLNKKSMNEGHFASAE